MEGGSFFDTRKKKSDVPGYIPAEDTYIDDGVIDDVNPFDNSSSSGAFQDAEHTPAISQDSENNAARERRTAFEEAIVQFSSRLPEDLSIPAVYELAKLPEQKIQEYEQKYRLLDDALKGILKIYIPGLSLPSFNELEKASSRGEGRLPDFLRRKIQSEYVHFLQKQTLSQILTHLALFEAIAENIGNARYIRERGTGTE